jgi:molybdate transport system regulatory protein
MKKPPASRRAKPLLGVQGALWLSVDGRDLGERGRLGLLKAVAEQGSITRAARAFGLSYKAAWDWIDAMNQIAGRALVERTTGGAGGGSTRLTEYGHRLIERFEHLETMHSRFLHRLATGALDLEREFSYLDVMNVKTSARNQWLGEISTIRPGAVNDEIEVLLAGGIRLAAVITQASTQTLGLKPKGAVLAMVKAASIVLATDAAGVRFSASNRWCARVRTVTPGTVNAEVALTAEGGLEVVAMVPGQAIEALALAPEAPITVLIKASDVILATLD